MYFRPLVGTHPRTQCFTVYLSLFDCSVQFTLRNKIHQTVEEKSDLWFKCESVLQPVDKRLKDIFYKTQLKCKQKLLDMGGINSNWPPNEAWPTEHQLNPFQMTPQLNPCTHQISVMYLN